MMPEIRIYTITHLRDWLLHNCKVEGLSEEIVTYTRAWAIINNPYVRDNDPIISAIFIDNKVVAYTSAFPESINNIRKWWFSALWCDSKYHGKGYGLIVIGSLAEIYGVENCLDRWGAQETIEIFSYLGHNTHYSKRYVLGYKINHQSFRGKVISIVRKMQKHVVDLFRPRCEKVDYEITYIPCIDERTYEFIQNNRNDDYFLHSIEMMNWVMHYSFTIAAPLLKYVKAKSFYNSEVMQMNIYSVNVIREGVIIGFYMLKQNERLLHVLYLYYEEENKDLVFASIRDHIRALRIEQFFTDDKQLFIYIRKQIYFPKHKTTNISFSFPHSLKIPLDCTMQYADGDNFVQ
jgi:hypothetical protein